MLFWSFALVFLTCEFCEQLTKHFEMLEDAVCQCNWHLFSLKMQRIFVVVLTSAQQPVAIEGFGNALCTRDAFKKVIVI